MSRKVFAAALLLAALSARAQVEVRPVGVLPSAPGIVAHSPGAALMPMTAPLPLAAFDAPITLPSAVPAPALASAPPPAQVRAEAMSSALVDFARSNVGAASAGDARGAGETLMLRALGARADGPTAVLERPEAAARAPELAPAVAGRPAGPRTYMLSRPLRETVRLGPVSLAGHLLFEAGYVSFKLWLFVWNTTHSPAAVAAAALFEFATSPPVWLPARTALDLGQRYWRRKLSVLREIARAPGVERVRVLTTGQTRFLAGVLAQRKDNVGGIFVESTSGLPPEVGRFGAPILIEDARSQRVRMTLAAPGAAAPQVGESTLSGLLDGSPVPAEIAAAWRAAISGKGANAILAAAAKKSALRIDLAFVGPGGTEEPRGSIAEGPSVKTLIGLGRVDRVRAWLRRARLTRRLPVSDARVERPGDARAPGPRAALARAWQRLTGRLIVAK